MEWQNPSPHPVHVASFTGVDELDEANREVGWSIEYRQLHRGPFSASFGVLEEDGVCLVSERFNSRLQISAEPPPGMIGLVIPAVGEGTARACGEELAGSEVVVFAPGSEMEFLTKGRIGNEAFYLPEESFQEMAGSLFPGAGFSALRSAAIVRGDPLQLSAVREVAVALLHGTESESLRLSDLVGQVMALMLEGANRTRFEGRLDSGVAVRVAGAVRDYIENHFREPIRMEDLCREVGVGLRSVQRSFAQHYQSSPSDYIKARRLNAARRELAASNPEDDSVTTIALGCGFTHLGRFSIDYRAHFGESPRVTLAR